MTATTWSVTKLRGNLGPHTAAWDELNQRHFSSHPMLDSIFANAALAYFDNGAVYLCVLDKGAGPEAMCLLTPRSAGIWASFLPSQAQIGPTLMRGPELMAELMKALPGFVTEIDFLCQDPGFSDFPEIVTLGSNYVDHALTIRVQMDNGFEAYWQSRSKTLRRNIERYEQRLAADGFSSSLACLTAAEEMGAAVQRYAALESMGWKGTNGTALGVDNEQGAFYSRVMAQFANQGHAMVFELRFNGQLVASRLMVCCGSMVVLLKTAFDESYAKYAPGRLLLHDMLRELAQRRPRLAVEFYTDAPPDLLTWATDQRWIRHVAIARSDAARALNLGLRGIKHLLPVAHADKKVDQGGHEVAVYRHPDQLPADVRQVFSVNAQDNFQTGSDWYGNLIDTVFSGNAGVHIYVLHHHGHALAALPVVVEASRFGSTVRSLSNYYTSLYAPICAMGAKERHLATILRHILAAHAPVISMTFDPMDVSASSFRWLEGALSANQLNSFRYFCFGNWHLRVSGDWQAYLAGRTGTLRNTIKRMEKKFSTQGGHIEVTAGADKLERALADYAAIYAASWKVPEPFQDFVPGLARSVEKLGGLRMGIAYLDKQPVAAQLWVVRHQKASIFKVAYDEKFKAYSPGTLVTATLMQHVIEQDRVTEVDYLTGDDDYKKTWMSDRRERWGIVAYNPRTVAGMWGLCRELLGRGWRLARARWQAKPADKKPASTSPAAAK